MNISARSGKSFISFVCFYLICGFSCCGN